MHLEDLKIENTKIKYKIKEFNNYQMNYKN